VKCNLSSAEAWRPSDLITQILHRKNSVYLIGSQLIRFCEIISVYCENNTIHINNICGKVQSFFDVHAGVHHSNHSDLEVFISFGTK